MTIVSIGGWALQRLVELDEVRPGVAGHMLRASPERRQVLAAFFAMARPYRKFDSDGEIGSFLMEASHDAILHAAYGPVPSGLRAALGRAGPIPHPRRFYRYLYALMSPGRQAIGKIVSRLPTIDLERLRVLRLLPSDMRHDNIIANIGDVADALDLRAYVSLLTDYDVDRGALIDALASASSKDALTSVARRWALKARLPEHPVPASDAYRPITNGDELRRVALRHRNCMRMYLVNILEQRSAFALFRHDDQEVVVHLLASERGWELDRLYNRTGPISSATRKNAEGHLRQHGVRFQSRSTTTRPLDPIRRMTAQYDPEGRDD
jgi:hypothetical protein